MKWFLGRVTAIDQDWAHLHIFLFRRPTRIKDYEPIPLMNPPAKARAMCHGRSRINCHNRRLFCTILSLLHSRDIHRLSQTQLQFPSHLTTNLQCSHVPPITLLPMMIPTTTCPCTHSLNALLRAAWPLHHLLAHRLQPGIRSLPWLAHPSLVLQPIYYSI